MAANYWKTQIDTGKWTEYKACSCGGVYRVKYRNTANPQLELHVLPERNRFSILEGNRQIASKPLTELNETLQNL